MSEALTIGVLTPFLGGWYFGGLLDGIARAAAGAGAKVVALQTLDAGTGDVEITRPRDPGYRMAGDHVAGFIVVVNAVSPAYLAGILADGKPIVGVSHEFADMAVPVVLPDNGVGIRAAVAHLVQHGHRRIAFVGCLSTADIHERYEAYRDALRSLGLEPDDELLFAASDNQVTGGVEAARAMMAAGLLSTAVVAGTDANAIGVMRALTAAGHHVPHDQAVIGFDDGPSAAFATPRLSTVRHPVQAIAQTAVATLLAGSTDDGAGTARHRVPTELVMRESCGCPGDASASTPEAADRRAKMPALSLVAGGHRATSASPGPGSAAGLTLLSDLSAAARHLRDDMPSMVKALRQQAAQARFDDGIHLQTALSTQYEVSMDLLRGHQEDPRRLDWLGRTTVSAGCLGLWTQGHSPTDDALHLEIVGRYEPDGMPFIGPAPRQPVTDFPPPWLLASADGRAGEVVFVVPVKVADSDWGLLALVDGVETTVATGREPISQWTALLSVALDHQAMLGALRDQESRLRSAALYDHLTGLPNRTQFLHRLQERISHNARRAASPFGVLFLDIDDFKVINDSLGHSVGDRLLIEVAGRIRAALRDGDTAARFGGDEFLILLDSVEDMGTATELADRLHTTLRDPFSVDGQQVVLTASVGIALGGGRSDDAEGLLRDADLAMYSAKATHRGSHAVFDVAMHVKAVERLRIETQLRHGIERVEFEVHYQPIVELGTGRTHGFEALVRWRHPSHGLLAPDRFLPIAEQTGLILPLSRWILAESCRQLVAWQSAGGAPELSISVNVSNRQFWQSPLVEDVAEVLHHTGLSPHCLALEITEGVIMRDVDRACELLQDLHRLGCRLHIDDFGTGYSSLEALHTLPIDALKIDRSFVSSLVVNKRSGELVRTIILMGQNLGMDLIAEGIETQEHLDTLVQAACPLGQGYLFSRPVPADQAGVFVLPTS